MSERPFLLLGRYGDIVSLLPLLWHENLCGRRRTLIVSDKFADLLEGVSYCDVEIFQGWNNELSRAIEEFKDQDPIVFQAHKNTDREHRTDSYQKEQWRLGGFLEEFGRYPLVIDRRDFAREQKLVLSLSQGKPFVLVATESASSPFSKKKELLEDIRGSFPAHEIIDLSAVKAEKPFDLLGLYDFSECLISVDSIHLHLAHASKVPVIAILNDGWKGSVPPPTTVKSFRYADFLEEDSLFKVSDCLEKVLEPSSLPQVYLCLNIFGESERHRRAAGLRAKFFAAAYKETRISIIYNDSKDHLVWKELFRPLYSGAAGTDIVFWTNDDCSFDLAFLRETLKAIKLYGACSIRRKEIPDKQHCGREFFGFTVSWLQNNWDRIPDYCLGMPYFDLGLAALIRQQRGVNSTLENMDWDFYPCDLPKGFVVHEAHPSSWLGKESEPDYQSNRRLFKEWIMQYQPGLLPNSGVE